MSQSIEKTTDKGDKGVPCLVFCFGPNLLFSYLLMRILAALAGYINLRKGMNFGLNPIISRVEKMNNYSI